MRTRTQFGVVMWAVVVAVVLVMSWQNMLIATAQEIDVPLATNTPAVVLDEAPIPDPDETQPGPVVNEGDTAPIGSFEWVVAILAALVVGISTIQSLTGRMVINKNSEMLPVLLNFAAQLAAMTPGKADDKAVQTISTAFGYDVEHGQNGTIILKPRGQPAG